MLRTEVCLEPSHISWWSAFAKLPVFQSGYDYESGYGY